MPEANRKPLENQGNSDLGLEGFEQFFDEQSGLTQSPGDTTDSALVLQSQVQKLLERFGELITLSVDQRMESSRMSNQLIDNQRQLIATQQILIKLMEKNIELTRHITSIEEKLPTLFEVPKVVEGLRHRVAMMEGVEIK